MARAGARKLPGFFHGFPIISLCLFLSVALYSCDPESSSGKATPPKPKAWYVSTFAGGGAINGPFSLTQSGNTFYVVDINKHNLNAIDKNTAQVQTIVTSYLIGGYVNGAGTVARFKSPRGIVAAAGNTLYVADSGNNRIRRVRTGTTAATTQVSDFAGDGTRGHANGTGAAAKFNNLSGLAISGSTLYVADYSNNRIRAINIASSAVSDFAGSGTPGHANGTGTAAQFNNPSGIAISDSTLYVADSSNHRIRAIDIASRTVSDFAGSGTTGSTNGKSTAAQFNSPMGIVANGNTLYIADFGNKIIRKIEYK